MRVFELQNVEAPNTNGPVCVTAEKFRSIRKEKSRTSNGGLRYAVCLRDGNGVPQNLAQAAHYFKLSVD
jgi:TPR repeat protein